MLKKLSTLAPSAAALAKLKDEPMVFSADIEFAYRYGGELTGLTLDRLLSGGHLRTNENVVIDTRVHMLKPGWNPAIGGWHCDAIPRGADGQPDFDHPAIPDIRHYFTVIDMGSGSLTEFVDPPEEFLATLPRKAPEGENLWGNHSRAIQDFIDGHAWETMTVESCGLYQFETSDYHTSRPATGHGWRFFLRASVNTVTKGPLNEIRKQVQVYMPDEHLGW